MGRFGMSARPFEHCLQVGCALDLHCRRIVERCVVYGPDDLPGHLVAKLEEVREIVLAESRVVVLQPSDAFLFLYGCLVREAGKVRE